MPRNLRERLEAVLGSPTSRTMYVERWHIADGFDLVYSVRAGHVVWITWSRMVAAPPMGTIVLVGIGKNSNIPHRSVPSLKRGGICLEVRARAADEIDDLLGFIAAKR
jgi:hypothetical protein